MIQFQGDWVALVTLAVNVILPLIVGWVTTLETSPGKKAVALAVLSAVAGFGAELLNAIANGQSYNAFDGLVTAFTAFLIAVGMHFGFWRPVGAAAKAQSVGGFIK